MKFTLSALALAASFAASAQTATPSTWSTLTANEGPKAFIGWDADRQNGSGEKVQEYRAGLSQKTRYGTFDGSLRGQRVSPSSLFGERGDNANGFEVGYSNGYKYDRYTFTGRVAYGRFNNIDMNGGGFTGSTGYGKFGLEASTPINDRLAGFVGYEHRNSFNDKLAVQNKYTVGVDYAFTQRVSGRVGYGYTAEAGGRNYNGIVTRVSYAF